MITKLTVIKTDSTDVFVNQGVEYALLNTVSDGELILYLWSNLKAVVVGRNQCAYEQCNVDSLEKDGGKLARRLSGGGAVYHDFGNLNFTFIAKSADFSLETNRHIILTALQSLGFNALLTGRNDIEIDGFKVSGNAYYKRDDRQFHHGTMLISSAPETVARYLTPNKSKFAKKAVKSVVSRVSSLTAFNPNVTKEDFAAAMIEALKKEYPKADVEDKPVFSVDRTELSKGIEFFSNNEWRYGQKLDSTVSVSTEYCGDMIAVEVTVDASVIVGCAIYTDSMDENLSDKIKSEIIGKNIDYNVAGMAAEGSVLRALQAKWYEI